MVPEDIVELLYFKHPINDRVENGIIKMQVNVKKKKV